MRVFFLIGEGYILCTSSNCQLLSVYIGFGGIILSLIFIALTAVVLSRFWSSVLRSICSLEPESCCTKLAVGLYTILLLVLWFLICVLIPTLVFWLWDPWKHENWHPKEDRGFVAYHHTVFATVMSVGFGDRLLVDVDYMSIIYAYCMFAHAFLGSIFAFVSRFVCDERTVLADYYHQDEDDVTTATTSYRVNSERENSQRYEYRGVII